MPGRMIGIWLIFFQMDWYHQLARYSTNMCPSKFQSIWIHLVESIQIPRESMRSRIPWKRICFQVDMILNTGFVCICLFSNIPILYTLKWMRPWFRLHTHRDLPILYIFISTCYIYSKSFSTNWCIVSALGWYTFRFHRRRTPGVCLGPLGVWNSISYGTHCCYKWGEMGPRAVLDKYVTGVIPITPGSGVIMGLDLYLDPGDHLEWTISQ